MHNGIIGRLVGVESGKEIDDDGGRWCVRLL